MKLAKYIFPLIVLLSAQAKANDIDFGVGIGSLYSGIGININTVTDGYMLYGAYGCQKNSSLAGTLCGGGAGWVTTSLFDSDKHGLGIYYGLIDGSTISRNGKFHWDSEYGFTIGYHYFANGIGNAGLTTGISASKDSIWLQLGYQF